ncbi:MAG: hypothetical protein ACYC2Y_00280 [Armatimonadota bacterium]
MRIALAPSRVFRYLLYTVFVLGIASFAVEVIRVETGHGRLMGFGSLFDAGAESNLPTWYSSFTLLFCAALLWAIASGAQRSRLHWRLLAGAFLYMSVDEACMLHERIGIAFEPRLQGTVLASLGWIAFFLPVVIAAALFFAGFVRRLPRETMRLFLLSGLLFLGGAIGMELIGGLWRTGHGENNLPYALMLAVEEPSEMFGVALFAYALMRHIVRHTEGVSVEIEETSATPELAHTTNSTA